MQMFTGINVTSRDGMVLCLIFLMISQGVRIRPYFSFAILEGNTLQNILYFLIIILGLIIKDIRVFALLLILSYRIFRDVYFRRCNCVNWR